MDKEQADVLWADVELRRRKNNQILFRRDSLCLQPLLEAIGEQDHRTVAAWALDCAWEPCRQLEERYEDSRPRQAIETCWAWARGQAKMRQAQQAILAAHAMAKEVPSPADAALCHAVGQACGAVHVETHAIGLPMYELTAIVRRAAGQEWKREVREKIAWYLARLEEQRQKTAEDPGPWATFLLKARPNKEGLLAAARKRGN